MLLGFQRRFAPFVEEGSKTHTIRGKRVNAPKVGETCHCYVDPRQRTMRLLGRWKCVRVERIRILISRSRFVMAGRVWIGDAELTEDEANLLAWRDGFRGYGVHGAFTEMVEYWTKLHSQKMKRQSRMDFKGQVIHWQYDEKTTGKALAEKARAAG